VGALRAGTAALVLFAAAQPVGAQGRETAGNARWLGLASEAAERFDLPVEWVLRVIAAESGGRTELGGRPITSHAGAMGLMQIMPATWASLRAQYGLGSDPHDPADNIVAGTAYLRAMYDRFGYPGLFAAYNAGPGRYGQYLSRGRPLPRETRDYVAKIAGAAPVAGASKPATGRPESATRQPGADREAPRRDMIFLTQVRHAQRVVDAPGAERAAALAASAATEITREPQAGGLFFVHGGSGRDGE
jgi:hypothetical protein